MARGRGSEVRSAIKRLPMRRLPFPTRYPDAMPPKTPKELKEQIEQQQRDQLPADGKERTAEGKKVRTPKRDEFFGNLEKVSESESD